LHLQQDPASLIAGGQDVGQGPKAAALQAFLLAIEVCDHIAACQTHNLFRDMSLAQGKITQALDGIYVALNVRA